MPAPKNTKPRILLTGANGQLAFDLARLLPAIGDVTALDRSRLDLTNVTEIRKAVQSIRPQVIVNAAAYTAVDKAESDEATARAVNAEAPAVLAEEGKKIGASLIHYSTDYVFDGTKTTPYLEDDSTNPLNVYGRTKLEGEEAIRAGGIPHLIFRTSWVYSTRGRNFLLTILRLATEREELRIVADQTGAPTRSLSIARASAQIIANQMSRDGRISAEVSGTYHMTGGGATSWRQFAVEICDAAKNSAGSSWLSDATKGKPLIVRNIVPIQTADYPTPARRPKYSVMSNQRLNKVFGLELPEWNRDLLDCFQE